MIAQRVVRIREVMQKDMSAIMDIQSKCFKDPYPLSLLNRLRVMYPDGFIVAETESRVVGYVIGIVRFGSIGHILAVSVDPMYQGQQIGSAMMKNMMERIQGKGARLVRLEVRKSNVDAQRFYLRMGFRMMEEIPLYYEDGETAVAMEFPY